MKEEISKIILDKYSEEEREAFFTKLKDDPALEAELKETFLLDVVNRMIHLKTSLSRKEKGFRKLWRNARSQKEKKRKLVFIGQAAAILGLVILSANLLYSNINRIETYTLRSERGSVSSVRISEETVFWLNTSSSAKVTKIGDKKVIVSLVGEGYFEVDQNSDRELLVDVGGYQLRDIGTSFNIKSYPDDDELVVSVFDGIIQLENSENELLKSIHGGEGVEVDLDLGTITPIKSDFLADTDWREGKFAFEQAPFSEILLEFEEWYDVEFEVQNEAVNSQTFTGVLKRKSSINDLMHIMKMTSDFKYTIEVKNDGGSLVYIY
jgi:ferric-dicitrate binding protein FerR (iron transport regulator)